MMLGIFTQQKASLPSWLPFVGEEFEHISAEFSTAQAVTPGQGQSVDIAGIQIGKVTSVDLEDGHAVVGCATVLVNTWNDQPACQLRGMAVDADYRRAGVGRMLLEEVDRVAIEAGTKILWANARKGAMAFYGKLGWKTVSEEFDIPLAGPHFKITKMI